MGTSGRLVEDLDKLFYGGRTGEAVRRLVDAERQPDRVGRPQERILSVDPRRRRSTVQKENVRKLREVMQTLDTSASDATGTTDSSLGRRGATAATLIEISVFEGRSWTVSEPVQQLARRAR